MRSLVGRSRSRVGRIVVANCAGYWQGTLGLALDIPELSGHDRQQRDDLAAPRLGNSGAIGPEKRPVPAAQAAMGGLLATHLRSLMGW
jgi:hypothetical protein